jgi:hypothetical protein
MARLFIFAIGGTGSRVLKSLTMLLASGIKPHSKTDFEIVPIIIDPHKSNDDLKRTARILGSYQAISEKAGVDSGFFSTRITTLDKLMTSQNRLSGSFTFNLQQVANTKFKDYIDFAQLSEPSRALADILFSGKSIDKRNVAVNLLDVEMDIGFVGNPNIGSVVLNQFKDSEEFKEVASNFNADDRIFIISSIFGGTGAAGFPTILKNIRGAMNNKNIDGKGFLQDAKIGAISVLPYFNIEKDKNSPIQKSDFIAKTKAALSYYKDNVTGNNSVNALYYISDDYSGKPYKNDAGNGGQKNDAHFVELASALAVLDFLGMPDENLQSVDGKAVNPVYKEFGMKYEKPDFKFSDFEDFTERAVSLRISQMAMFRKYLNESFSDSIEKQAWTNDEPIIHKSFLTDSFYRSNLSEFMDSFGDWLKEMSYNRRGFTPFNLDTTLDSLVVDKTVKKGWLKKKVDYSYYDGELSKKSKGKSFPSAEQKLIKLFFDTTEDILTAKFGFKKQNP